MVVSLILEGWTPHTTLGRSTMNKLSKKHTGRLRWTRKYIHIL